MKKALSILLAVLMLAVLCACGGADVDYIYFQNDTGAKVDGFYISSTTSDTWGDALNFSSISIGAKVYFNVDRLAEGPGYDYDVGAIDENGMIYEFYDIPVNIDDVLAISADGEVAYLNRTDAEGNATLYEGYAYMQNDE